MCAVRGCGLGGLMWDGVVTGFLSRGLWVWSEYGEKGVKGKGVRSWSCRRGRVGGCLLKVGCVHSVLGEVIVCLEDG